ncbi:MAG TPA: hypothetical protein VGT04_13610 [Acidobacteriaceae bacterium]|nr:hypothetical protein [Acidobacteriaceae bacterium]
MNPNINPHKTAALALAVLLTPALSCIAFADSSYQSTTQVTGGQLVDAVKKMSFLSKSMRNAFQPISTQTMVSGNRKAMVSQDATEIVDLDKQEMIHIDTMHKTYYVATFAQMRQTLEAAAAQIKQAQQQQQEAPSQPQDQQKPNVKVTFNASVNNTGQTRTIEGANAQEQIVTVTMTATDETNPANTSTITVTTDAWIVPDPPELKEIADFDRRMAKAMMQDVYMPAMAAAGGPSSAGMSQLLSSRPGASDAMTQMAKELARIKGTRVQEDTSMSATAPQNSSQKGASQDQANSESNSDTPTSRGSVESAAATKVIGGMLGGWHHKKAKQTDQQSDTPTTTTQNGQVMQTVTLLTTRDQKSNFSQQSIPDSAFEVPAGFKQVPSAYDKMH